MTRLSHGMSRTRFYRIYNHIWNRCNRKKNPNYKHYGGKGIKNEWDKFEDFKKDMYGEYIKLSKDIGEENVSIERNKNHLNYCKDNCKWIHLVEQQENRDNNRYITYKGETHNLRKWCRLLGLSEGTMRKRITIMGWAPKKAFETPLQNKTIYKLSGEKGTLKELSNKLKISRSSVYRYCK